MTITGDDFTFGALLQTFRKRQRLTQQALAEAVGVHRRTLVRWEQGDYLPESKAQVLELARHLKLDDQETRHFLEASLTALAPYWLVPFPRNPFFTGREEILEVLHAQLGVAQAVALTQSSALHGLGGVGKTQIALEYAYRHSLEYSAVFWIGAETEEQIVSSLLRIAEVLQLPGRDGKDQQQAIADVQRWLSVHDQWLLIWDNVEDLAQLDRFLPSIRSGAILITTRCQTLGTLARGVDLLPMEHEEGMLFLLRRAKVLEPEATYVQVSQLAEQMPLQYAAGADMVTAMGGLPLALDQAGAYLEATQCGLPVYLDLFYTRRAILLQQRGEGSRDHPASVSTTFTLAITATATCHPAVWDLLRICALLQPDGIPEELFRQGAEHFGTTLASVCHDELEWNQVIRVACSYSLLSRQSEELTLSIHRLVQAVLLDTMTKAEWEQWTQRAIRALDTAFPEILPTTEYAAWKQGEQLLPHALLCLERATTSEESLALASLAYKTAQYLRARGQYGQAESLLQRALYLQEQILGPDHPDVATSLNYLAILYRGQGKYTQVEPLYQRALRIWEQTQGPDHPDIARVLNNLANLYRRLGKYEEAEPLYQRALHLREQAQGPDHPLVASTLNNIAILYFEQGKYTQAESLLQRALRLREQALGPDHPDVAASLSNLAEFYSDRGKYVEAKPLYQQALQIWERVLGPDHPDVAASLNGLANFYREQGKYAEAEPLYLHVFTIREQHLGQHHPETAQTLHDLAIFRQKQDSLSEAISLVERALLIRSQTLGETHPKTTATRALRTQLLQKQAWTQGEADSEISRRRDSRLAQRRASYGKRGAPFSRSGQSRSLRE